MTTEIAKPADAVAAPPPPADAAKAPPAAAVVETKPDAKTSAIAAAVDEKKPDPAAAAAAEDAAPFADLAQLKLADGQKLDEAAGKEFLAAAKDLGLSAKQARGLLGLNTKLAASAETARAEKVAAADKAAAETLRNDKEIGGANYEKSMALAGKAIRNVLGVEFGKWATSLELADGSLLGNRVEFARALVKLGATVSEDSNAGTQGSPAPKGKSLTEQLYGPGTVKAGPNPATS